MRRLKLHPIFPEGLSELNLRPMILVKAITSRSLHIDDLLTTTLALSTAAWINPCLLRGLLLLLRHQLKRSRPHSVSRRFNHWSLYPPGALNNRFWCGGVLPLGSILEHDHVLVCRVVVDILPTLVIFTKTSSLVS